MDQGTNYERITSLIGKREAERQLDVKKKREEKKLISAENEQYNIFSQMFRDRVARIELMLASPLELSPLEHVDNISKEIRALQKFVTDSILFIRGYDMRVCQGTLQDLELSAQKLEDRLLPKKKFGFKTKRTAKKADKSVTQPDGPAKPAFPEQFYGFKNKTNETLHLGKELLKKDVTLQNLTGCVIKLYGSASTLHMSDLEDCTVLAGPVSTSVFAEKCIDCKLVVSCQQLRLHSSNGCDVYVHVTSRAIIEDCHKICVAPYNLTYTGITEDFAESGLDRSLDNWDQVDDFNWLVADKHSPNWAVLDQSCFITDWESYTEMKNF